MIENNVEFSAQPADVVVTAGGTREPIDDVRFVGNFSSGKLGHTIASELTEMGRRVICLAPKETIERFGEHRNVEYRAFSSSASLQQRIDEIPTAQMVIHSAAVADYSPDKTEGKIRSDDEELIVRMQRTPKILAAMREHFGPSAYLVGFKLLSHVDEEELVKVARHQIVDNRTDLVIANDLQDIKQERKVLIVHPKHEPERIQGTTAQVAAKLAVRLDLLSTKKWLHYRGV